MAKNIIKRTKSIIFPQKIEDDYISRKEKKKKFERDKNSATQIQLLRLLFLLFSWHAFRASTSTHNFTH